MATTALVRRWLTMCRDLTSGTDANLVFNADETMIDFKEKGGKVVIQRRRKAYRPDQVKARHMPALLCTNRMGDGRPPRIILNCLVNILPEFRELKDFRACWFASAGKRWITCYLFS
jgi:hypothetical protein